MRLLVALFVASLAFRPQLIGVGPLAGRIQEDLGVAHAVVGLLPAVMLVGMGALAYPAPVAAARLGTRVAVAVCIAIVAVAGVARAIVPGVVGLVALTVVVAVGNGLGNALLTLAVKERLAQHAVLATGVYTAGLQLGGTYSSFAAIPIADASGGWRSPLLAFSALTGVCGVVWWLFAAERGTVTARLPRLPLRRRVAWLVAAFFAALALLYYGLSAWISGALVEAGWSEAHAGVMLGVWNLAALSASLAVGAAGERGTRRAWLAGSLATMTAMAVLVIVAPGLAFVWIVVLGAANGAAFSYGMLLPLDAADTPIEVGGIAALMLGVGYTLGALAPFALGGVRDLTGSFAASLWIAVGIGCAGTALALSLSPSRLRRGVRARSL